jgi:hypothetical protein
MRVAIPDESTGAPIRSQARLSDPPWLGIQPSFRQQRERSTKFQGARAKRSRGERTASGSLPASLAESGDAGESAEPC